MSSFFTLSIFFSSVVSFVISKNGGFSIKLYHREGPGSPFYDPTLSKMDRINRGIKRDLTRANRNFTNTPNTLVADLKKVGWTYMMKFALGTPPYEFFGYVDTGSAKTWIQCHPCELCYYQNDPIFNPKKSSTYRVLTCTRQTDCPAILRTTCKNKVCTHISSYADESYSEGKLSIDMMTIQSTTDDSIKVNGYIFGCGTYNKGRFKPEAAGVIGLGRGPDSLITQLNEHINGKFSYCMSRDIETGKINFGDNVIVQGSGVVTTPLIIQSRNTNPYYQATLEGLTIGTERLNFNTERGNIVIDTGGSLSTFPEDFYNKIKDSITRQITATRIPVHGKSIQVCFEDVNGSFQFIPMTAHFVGGADVVLKKFNMFINMAPELICLAVSKEPEAVWGNIAQLDFMVGFDLVTKKLSFKSNSC